MTTVQVELPPKLIPIFQGSARYRGAYGGRGSAKTRSFALMTAIRAYMFAEAGIEGVILCGREFMNSLDDSSMEEIKTAIRSVPWLKAYFDIGEKYIRTKNNRVRYVFSGLTRNLDSLKSKARVLIAWIDEGEGVSENGWRKLTPTVREDNSEIWVTWNPEGEESSTHKRFRKTPPTNSKIIEINYMDNPWFPDVLEQERLDDQRLRPDDYNHIWNGGFRQNTEAQIFKNWKIEALETPDNVVWFYGADWGFANDPTAALRCCIMGTTLYVDYEASQIGCEMEATPTLLGKVPDIHKWPLRADNARPETIDYVRRNGFPKIRAAKKGKGSIEHGINFLKGFDIVVHPRCVNLINELKNYSYKIDKQTEEILPVVADAWNHLIDALRYAVEGLHRKGVVIAAEETKTKRKRDYDVDDDEDDYNWKTA